MRIIQLLQFQILNKNFQLCYFLKLLKCLKEDSMGDYFFPSSQSPPPSRDCNYEK